jgi:hypothetical protein
MADFVAPNFAPPPDFFGTALRAQMAPIQRQAAIQQMAQSQQEIAQSQQIMSQQSQSFPVGLAQAKLALQGLQLQRQVVLNDPGVQQALGQGGQSAQSAQPGADGIQNDPQASAPGDSSQTGLNGTIGGYRPSTMMANALLGGGDPLKTAEGVQNYQLTQNKIRAAGPMSLMETGASSPVADQLIRNPQNTDFQQMWMQVAPKLNLDPFRDLTALNARRAFTMAYNGIGAQAGGTAAGFTPKPDPYQMRNIQGMYGQQLQQDPNDLKLTQVAGREVPGGSMQTVTDLTGKRTGVLVPTQGMDPQGRPIALSGGKVDLGMEPPTDAMINSAGFAAQMRSSFTTMRQLETPTSTHKGFVLPSQDRSLLINAAGSNDTGLLMETAHQLLEKFATNPDAQTYISAAIPAIAAASYDEAGTRLNPAKIKIAISSLLPRDLDNKADLAVVYQTRTNMFNKALTGAQRAVGLPKYKNTLGVDAQAPDSPSSGQGTAPPAALQYLTQHPDKAPQFKAKYGYLPGG